nr:Chain C, iCAL36-VQD peptide [synthetic construct]4K72_D Chain D, iCAL36-VQD peptide [synthetic construct]
ANSRVQDSII